MAKTAIIVPCYNEADGIPQLAARLATVVQQLGNGVEVIFIDDGSTDGTADILCREAQSFPHRIIKHEKNKGLGAALKTGFDAADAEEVVTIDSDCTYEPEKIIDLLSLLRSGCDIVTGSPYHPQGEVVGVPEWRLLLSKSLSYVYWLILPQRLYTYTSCFRAYRSAVLPKLKAESDGFLGVTQLLVSGILRGAVVAELPARLTRRQFGQSKIKIASVILSHLRYISSIVAFRLFGAQTPASRRSAVVGKAGSESETNIYSIHHTKEYHERQTAITERSGPQRTGSRFRRVGAGPKGT